MLDQAVVDTSRHNAVFLASAFGDSRVDVIGCGATGSRIAMSLAKLGVINLHLWDFDIIEEHNIANQLFGLKDIGRLKVEVLAERILADTGMAPTIHNERVDGTQPLGAVVFLLTDTMASRKEIWEAGIRYRPYIQLMVETRMGAVEGRVYCVRPTEMEDCEGWEKTLYADDVAVESSCGSRVTVGPTADLIAGHAIWGFIRWWQHSQDATKFTRGPSEYIFGAMAPIVFSNQF